MSKIASRLGMQFGRLKVVSFSRLGTDKKTGRGYALWNCECSCGKTVEVRGGNLRGLHSGSCGCLAIESRVKNGTTHGFSKTKFFSVWGRMKSRCMNPKMPDWMDYGGRGISVVKRWHSFENFKEDMLASYLSHVEEFGEKNTSIDRIDNEKGYSKKNCRWATKSEQNRNTRLTHLITFRGQTKCIATWAEEMNINRLTLRQRIIAGWPLEKAMTEKSRRAVPKLILFNGEPRTAWGWGKIVGLNESVIKTRIKCGWTVEEALTTPTKKYNY